MHKIYLVCTRAAISASALTYIINHSSDFYNTEHNNVWDNESNDDFGTAYTINDWWNIDDNMRDKLTYNKYFRNTSSLTENDLIDMSAGFNSLNLDKNICLFTHATNTADLINYRNKHNLPIVIVTTVFGKYSGMFVNSWIKREYSNEMNTFVDVFSAWEYLYTQRTTNDEAWSSHADYTLKMHDWLIDPSVVYTKLQVSDSKHIQSWTADYLKKNNAPIAQHSETVNTLTALQHLYDAICPTLSPLHDRTLLCYDLFEVVYANPNCTTEDYITLYNKNH